MATKEIASLYQLKGAVIVWENWLKDCIRWLQTDSLTDKERALTHLITIQTLIKSTLEEIEKIKKEEENDL